MKFIIYIALPRGLLLFFMLANTSLLLASESTEYIQEFIVAPGQFKANHGSSLLELDNGGLLSCWYAGSAEKASDVQIYCSNRPSDQKGWQKPVAVVASGEKASGKWLKNLTLGNTVLFRGQDNVIWLFYTAVTVGTGWSGSHVDYKTSTDNGVTWSKQGKRLFWYWGNLSRNKPLILGKNKILLPIYHELFQVWGFTCVLKLKGTVATREECQFIPGIRHLQPSLISISSEEIFGYLRNKKKTKVLLAKLNRNTHEWSEPVGINLPNPNSPVDLVNTEDGILMVYNHSSKERSPLSLAISKDGIDFESIWNFENNDKESFSYPAFIQGSDHNYHLSYTYNGRDGIKYIRFSQEWLHNRINMKKKDDSIK